MENLSPGLTIGIAAVLAAAAWTKVVSIQRFELALVNLLPSWIWTSLVDSRRAAWLIAATEAFLAVGLITSAGETRMLMLMSVTALALVFGALSLLAWRQGVSCGCLGESTATGLAGLLRVLAFGTAAVVAPITNEASTLGDSNPLIAIAIGVGFAVALLALPVFAAGSSARTAQGSTQMAPEGAIKASRVTRRSLLKTAFVALLGVAVGHGSTQLAFAQPPRSCQARHDLCRGCCFGDGLCNACCISCYGQCQMGFPGCVPHVSCGGCWR